LNRICVFSHKTFIPPTSGHNIALFNMLNSLVKEGFIVDFHTYGQKFAEPRYSGINIHIHPFPSLAKVLFLNRFFRRLMDRAKSYEAYLCLSSLAPHFVSLAREELAKSDFVFVEHIWSSLFPIIYAKLFRKPAILVNRNAETVLSRRLLKTHASKLARLLLFLRLTYTFLLEKFACSLATRVFVTSRNDMAAISKHLGIPVRKIDVFPPGIETSRLKKNSSLGRAARRKLNIPSKAPIVCFLGDLTTVPNYISVKYIVEHIFPEVSASLPEACFLIIGRCGESSRSLTKITRIVFTGEAPDLIPLLSAADICIAPLSLGSGIKLKILTYFSFGKPVISTPIGMEGIGAKNGEEAIICGLKDFSKEILRLALDHELRSTLGENGRRFVEDNYDQDLITKRLIAALREGER